MRFIRVIKKNQVLYMFKNDQQPFLTSGTPYGKPKKLTTNFFINKFLGNFMHLLHFIIHVKIKLLLNFSNSF